MLMRSLSNSRTVHVPWSHALEKLERYHAVVRPFSPPPPSEDWFAFCAVIPRHQNALAFYSSLLPEIENCLPISRQARGRPKQRLKFASECHVHFGQAHQ
jgi:hypothetical protein